MDSWPYLFGCRICSLDCQTACWVHYLCVCMCGAGTKGKMLTQQAVRASALLITIPHTLATPSLTYTHTHTVVTVTAAESREGEEGSRDGERKARDGGRRRREIEGQLLLPTYLLLSDLRPSPPLFLSFSLSLPLSFSLSLFLSFSPPLLLSFSPPLFLSFSPCTCMFSLLTFL